jgi:hypothetical protein
MKQWIMNNKFKKSKTIAIFNTSEQSSAFNHEYGSWASELKAGIPTVRVIFP